MAADGFYTRDGDRFVATPLTRGPWSDAHQHGGPPAALIARAMEAVAAADGDWQFTRFTIDLLRPLAIGPALQVTAAVTRSGAKVLGLEGALLHDGRPVARAAALCVRRVAVELPPRIVAAARRPAYPEDLPVHTFSFFRWPVGYHTAVDGRRSDDGSIWLRPRCPLVEGEPLSPLQRVLIAADAINGVGFVLDVARYSFINADLTVHLHRMPTGPWVQLAASHTPQTNGVGLVDAALFDVRGSIGRAVETQVVARHG